MNMVAQAERRVRTRSWRQNAEDLVAQAASILRRNDTGGWTRAAHQWKTGKVPHIVFNPKAPPHSYYPGAEHGACAASSPDAPPAPPYTSCLCQPPVHAIAVWRIW